MGDLIEATGFVCVDFLRNNQVVHVRLDYHIYTRKHGYHIEIINIDTRDPALLMKLKDPKIKTKVLGFIMDQATGKLPSTAELEVEENE